ncbi:MAG: hypothetical protein KDB80_06895 [Planctomycetes bacterium]|nr:hypothetical protein [Planctomycetota bacterium]
MIVHVPIALAVLMPFLTAGLLLAIRRSWFRPRTWAIATAAQAVLVIGGMLAMRTGEADEERAESVVPETAIEAHEEAAERFVWVSGVVLLASFLPLVLRGQGVKTWSQVITVIGTGVVFGLGIQVGHAGGELVYRHGAAAAFVGSGDGSTPAVTAPAHDDDDD